MNPRQRLLTTLKGGVADRVPLILQGFHCESTQEIGDPARREIADRIHSEIHYFIHCPAFINRYLVTPPQRMKEVCREGQNGNLRVTTEIDTPKGKLTAVTHRNPVSHTIWTVKYPVESLADIEKIRSVPWESPPDLAPPDLSDIPDSFNSRGIVRAGISSPMVCVAGMMPYDYFLELCATELTVIKELTAICFVRILSVLDVVLSAGTVEYVWMGGCEWLTPPMGSAELYEELVQPFESEVIKRIHADGALSHVHCHGNVRSTLERVIDRGGDYFEPVEPPPDGDITFAEAKALAGGRITLGGNIEARVIEHESADCVEQATRSAFEGGKKRMVLQTTAHPISELTPRMTENYHRMIDVWEELAAI
jgi:hypothetical protein